MLNPKPPGRKRDDCMNSFTVNLKKVWNTCGSPKRSEHKRTYAFRLFPRSESFYQCFLGAIDSEREFRGGETKTAWQRRMDMTVASSSRKKKRLQLDTQLLEMGRENLT
jgi:hypothetical protein